MTNAATAEKQDFARIMSAAEFEASVKQFIAFPDTREKRFTMKCLPGFMKYDAPTFKEPTSLAEWWDAFGDYLQACDDR